MNGKKETKEDAENVVIKFVNGVAKSGGFSIAPNGEVGIAFNQLLDQFVVINLKNGEHSALNNDPLATVKKVARWEGLHLVERQSKIIVLMMAVEKRTDKTYLISFTEDKAGVRMKVLDELYLGVLDPKDSKLGCKKTSYIGEDGNGAIYCFTAWLDFNDSTKKATFHAVNVTVDGDGKLQAKVVFDARSVQGAHLKLPLADKTVVYMLPVHNQYDEEKIVKLPLKGAAHPKIIHPKYGEGGMPPFFCPWSYPIHFNDDTALFYVYGLVGSNQVGQFWTLNLPNCQWRKLSYDLQEHAVKDNISIVRDANDNTLLLHGDCADDNCADKAHVYRFNFDKMMAAKPSGLAVPSAQTIKRKANDDASLDSKAISKPKSSRTAKKPKNSSPTAKVQAQGTGRLTRSKTRH
uniref:Uncharacterized protein n=1 Tax=Plectus sambesii TaxID=2011161 RepID=A0A914WVI4_9BILA